MNNTQTCMECGHINNIPSYRLDAFAFECWNCKISSWLDDDSLHRYKVLNNIDFTQAQRDLDNKKVSSVDGEFGLS